MAEAPERKANTETQWADAASGLQREVSLMKMENDNIMSLAKAYPRNHAAVLADLKAQLATYKSFCEEAIYSKPVGKDRDTGKEVYARGLGIRAAEAIACAYKYNKVSCDAIQIDDDHVKLVAQFLDYQDGRVWSLSQIVGKTYKDRYGGTRRHSDDRFYNLVLKAEASKLTRECILRVVPPGLKSELMNAAEEQINAFLDDSTVSKIVATFSKKKIGVEQLEAYIGKARASWTKMDKMTLLGVWNAVEEGEANLAEMFPEVGGDDKPSGGKTQSVVDRIKAQRQKAEVQQEAPAQAPPAEQAPEPEAIPSINPMQEAAAEKSRKSSKPPTQEQGVLPLKPPPSRGY